MPINDVFYCLQLKIVNEEKDRFNSDVIVSFQLCKWIRRAIVYSLLRCNRFNFCCSSICMIDSGDYSSSFQHNRADVISRLFFNDRFSHSSLENARVRLADVLSIISGIRGNARRMSRAPGVNRATEINRGWRQHARRMHRQIARWHDDTKRILLAERFHSNPRIRL